MISEFLTFTQWETLLSRLQICSLSLPLVFKDLSILKLLSSVLLPTLPSVKLFPIFLMCLDSLVVFCIPYWDLLTCEMIFWIAYIKVYSIDCKFYWFWQMHAVICSPWQYRITTLLSWNYLLCFTYSALLLILYLCQATDLLIACIILPFPDWHNIII